MGFLENLRKPKKKRGTQKPTNSCRERKRDTKKYRQTIRFYSFLRKMMREREICNENWCMCFCLGLFSYGKFLMHFKKENSDLGSVLFERVAFTVFYFF